MGKEYDVDDKLEGSFYEIIDSCIDVFASENGMSKEEAKEMFKQRLSSTSIKVSDSLFMERGRTTPHIDTDNINQPVKKEIEINKNLLENKKELKSSLAHEIFHAVLADEKATEINGEYKYNMGCSETTISEGKVNTKGRLLHEAMVARMQKKFCQKNNIKFSEKNILGSAYAEPMRQLKKFEKIKGIKTTSNCSLETLNAIYGNDIDELAELMDEGNREKTDAFFERLQDEKIQEAKGKPLQFAILQARKMGRNIISGVKKIMPKNSNIKMLEAAKLDSNIVKPLNSHIKPLEEVPKKRELSEFEKSLKVQIVDTGTRKTSSEDIQQEKVKANENTKPRNNMELFDDD